MGESIVIASTAAIVAQRAPAFTIAHLRTAYATMIAAHPEQDRRLQRALAIVVAAEIERFISRGDAWQVQSLSDPDTYYVVTTLDRLLICSCPDAANRGLPCKHTLAIDLYRRAERLDAEEADPTQQPIGYALTGRGLVASTDPLAECADCGDDAIYHDGPAGACSREGVDAEGYYRCDCQAFTLGDDAA